MQLMKVSESVAARRRVPVYLVDADDNPVTGVTAPAVSLSANGQAIIPPIGPTWVEVGDGLYYLEFVQASLVVLGFFSIIVSDPLAPPAAFVTQTIFVQVVAFDPYTVQTNPNVNVLSWGESAETVPDTVVDFPNSYKALVAADFETTGSSPGDDYTAVWKDKDGPRPHGDVTDPRITVYDRSGNVKIDNQSMSAIGTLGAFTYRVTDSNKRIPVAETWIGVFTAIIDEETRTWRQGVTRP